MNEVASSGSARNGRAARPGRSGRSDLKVPTALIGATFAVLFVVLGIGTYGLIAKSRPNLADAASHIPKQVLDHSVDQTLIGTVARPALTVEGDYVEVRAATFSVLAVVNGPVVPGEGLPNQMPYTTCTWTISFSHVVGRVPIAVADFDSINHLGAVFKPYLVPGQPELPSVLVTGQRLTFQLRAVMPVGEGLMRWAPDGDHIVAKWDYQVEND
jgi:hypothetical protein